MRPQFLAHALLPVVALACVGLRHARPAPERLAGTFNARVALTGKGTYTGSFTVASWTSDSLNAAMQLTAPVGVDVPIRGKQTADTLWLHGNYSAANGCTGTMDATLTVGARAASAHGPVSMNDRCVGAMAGTMELAR